MKFKVRRTSLWDNEKPCKEAFQETYSRIEVRTLRSFEEFDEKFGEREGSWLLKGINHCINEMGYIQREFPDGEVGWFVEINTLEELLNFREKYGNIVITKAWENPSILELEIYDDYRE